MDLNDRNDILDQVLDALRNVRAEVAGLRSSVAILGEEIVSLNQRLEHVPNYVKVTMAAQRAHGEAISALERRFDLLVGEDPCVPVPTPPPALSVPVLLVEDDE